MFSMLLDKKQKKEQTQNRDVKEQTGTLSADYKKLLNTKQEITTGFSRKRLRLTSAKRKKVSSVFFKLAKGS